MYGLSDFFKISKSEIIGDDPDLSALRTLAELESVAKPKHSADEFELMLLFNRADKQGKELIMQTARMCAALSQKDGAGNTEDVERVGIVMS